MGHCLHEEIEEISTLLAGSTRVSRRVTRQGELTRLDYRFHVNAYKHLTAKGLPAAVIQLGVKSNPGSCKEALRREFFFIWRDFCLFGAIFFLFGATFFSTY